MRSVFKSDTSLIASLIIWGCIALLACLAANDIFTGNISNTYAVHIFDAIIIALLLWVWFKTMYAFQGDSLICSAGPFNTNIKISSIEKVDLSKKLWVGYRPALSFNGMVIHYEKYNEIFISPKDSEGFLSVLKRVNPTIKIIND